MVLVMEVKPEAFPLLDARVLVEASTVEAAFMVAGGMGAEVTGNSVLVRAN